MPGGQEELHDADDSDGAAEIREIAGLAGDLESDDFFEYVRGHEAFRDSRLRGALAVVTSHLVATTPEARRLAARALRWMLLHARHQCYSATDVSALVRAIDGLRDVLDREEDEAAREAMAQALSCALWVDQTE